MSGRGGTGQDRGYGCRWGRNQGARRARRDAASSGTLLALQPGDECVIGSIDDDFARAQAVRFGIGDGALVSCVTRLPGGPVVLRAGRQEIAIGCGLASRIEVSAHRTRTVSQA